MQAKLDQNVGPKLQRTMRHSDNEMSTVRAELLLRSGLGDSVDRLAAEYSMLPDEVRAPIVDFNVRRMKALARKRTEPKKTTMSNEDRDIINEMMSLTPQAFDLPDMRWLPDEIISFVKEHGLVSGIDSTWISERLKEYRFGR